MVSSTDIAHELALDPTQVRKDLSYTGITGRPRLGYDITKLIGSIESFLNWDNLPEAVLVGAGNLGSALLGYRGLEQHGLKIAAVFDIDPEKIGTRIQGKEVLPLDALPGFTRVNDILIGIITVPATASQEVADLLITASVKALWNFTPVKLDVPESIIVEDVELLSSLAVLSNRLARTIGSESTR